MKFEELLKAQGLSDEQITGVLRDMKYNKIYTTSLENADERYQKLKGQKEDIQGQLDTANSTIKELKKNNADNEALQKTIKDHEATIETLKKDSEAKIRNITLDSAINNLLLKNNAKHSDLLLGKFDRDKLVIKEDGSIEGLEEQFKGMKETYKDLFQVSLGGKKPANPDTSGFSNNTYEALLNNADNMTAEEVAEQFSKLNK
ncbi:phage scaffolding protein [Clostridium cylindrosporum]|uniref:Phage minor structural protein GP20 n=1 Tax=Clostridium cylindrosporum DSM 605 TaxID=1121307 RepID=A0A0J8G1F3_CLOCY|nr:phage scaffolding protein [Clostridium cylindrosporum]KMT21586.1 phage minor structural protein GP20 [Clostridium cylindrosporum DSM 605]